MNIFIDMYVYSTIVCKQTDGDVCTVYTSTNRCRYNSNLLQPTCSFASFRQECDRCAEFNRTGESARLRRVGLELDVTLFYSNLWFSWPLAQVNCSCVVYIGRFPLKFLFFNQLIKSCTWFRFDLRLSENCSSLFFLNPWLNQSQRVISQSQQKSTRLPSYALRSSLCNMR